MNAQQEVERLLGQIRQRISDPVVEKASDQIEILCRAYFEPDSYPMLPQELAGIHLTPSEHRVFHLLLTRMGKACSRDALMNVMEHKFQEFGDPKMVDVRICRVRSKLAGTEYAGRIETVWGQGYRMLPPAKAAA